jgi:hypothetical protein
MDKRDALYRQREKSIFFTKNKEIKSLEEEIDKTLEEMKSLNDKEFQEVSDLEKRKEELNKPKETITTETKVETPIQEEIPITETKAAEEVVAVPEATMFSEASDIKKIRNKQEKTAAETAFQEKHGVSYKKVSNINTNFATIVKNLENNNLIEKEC